MHFVSMKGCASIGASLVQDSNKSKNSQNQSNKQETKKIEKEEKQS